MPLFELSLTTNNIFFSAGSGKSKLEMRTVNMQQVRTAPLKIFLRMKKSHSVMGDLLHSTAGSLKTFKFNLLFGQNDCQISQLYHQCAELKTYLHL